MYLYLYNAEGRPKQSEASFECGGNTEQMQIEKGLFYFITKAGTCYTLRYLCISKSPTYIQKGHPFAQLIPLNFMHFSQNGV